MRIVILGILLVFGAVVVVTLNHTPRPEIETDGAITAFDASLTFSNTQIWDPSIVDQYAYGGSGKQLASSTQHYLVNISLPPFPQNSSSETAHELSILHNLIRERTPETQSDIHNELVFDNFQFGDFSVGTTTKSATSELIADAHTELIPVILTFKHRFDRVRPSVLDPRLSTTIPVPGHPAYPSGHATEAHLVAVLLSQLDPTNTDIYMAAAERIARNREIAGVHYVSDSKAGADLAQQFVVLYLQTEKGQKLLVAAQSEW